MISPEAIQKLATQHQTAALNVAREYCQHLFLSAFYQRNAADRVLLKGGTALHIIYGSPRFSEDLDFSGFGIRKPAIEELITDALSAVERVGLSIEIEEAKATSGGYLGIIHNRFGDFLPAYTLLHLPQELLVEEKLKALLDRAKPRDFYDLYFILRKGLLSQKNRQVLKEALTRLKATKSGPLQELKLFLPRDQQAIAKDFRGTLERELKRYLGK